MADAHSRKKYANELQATPESEELCAEFAYLKLGIVVDAMEIEVTPTLEEEILKG